MERTSGLLVNYRTDSSGTANYIGSQGTASPNSFSELMNFEILIDYSFAEIEENEQPNQDPSSEAEELEQ
jgi:hypothetical protein